MNQSLINLETNINGIIVPVHSRSVFKQGSDIISWFEIKTVAGKVLSNIHNIPLGQLQYPYQLIINGIEKEGRGISIVLNSDYEGQTKPGGILVKIPNKLINEGNYLRFKLFVENPVNSNEKFKYLLLDLFGPIVK